MSIHYIFNLNLNGEMNEFVWNLIGYETVFIPYQNPLKTCVITLNVNNNAYKQIKKNHKLLLMTTKEVLSISSLLAS